MCWLHRLLLSAKCRKTSTDQTFLEEAIGNLQDSMAHISEANAILLDVLTQRVQAMKVQKGVHLEHRIHEFDDFRYWIVAAPDIPTRLQISVGVPSIQEPRFPQATLNLLQNRLGEFARLEVAPREGYDVTIDVALDVLAGLPEQERKKSVNSIASIRLLLCEPRLRVALQNLADGRSARGPVECFRSNKGGPYFVKPQENVVTIVYPVPKHSNDPESTLAACFLKQFAETQVRAQAQGAVPPACRYHPPRQPPAEVLELDKEALGNCEGGFISMTLHQRHVTGGGVERVLWSLVTFRAFIAHHIKWSKAHFHTRMRANGESMLARLTMARFDKGVGERLRRTATGRIFGGP